MLPAKLDIQGSQGERRQLVLNDGALALVAGLEAELGPRRKDLLERRRQLQSDLAHGARPGFRKDTEAIFNLMEDAATAEIARAQILQWCHNRVALADGRVVTPDFVRALQAQQLDVLLTELSDTAGEKGRAKDAAELFESVALSEQFVDFLTIPAYERLEP